MSLKHSGKYLISPVLQFVLPVFLRQDYGSMPPVFLCNFCTDPLKKKNWDIVERPDSQLDADIYFWYSQNAQVSTGGDTEIENTFFTDYFTGVTLSGTSARTCSLTLHDGTTWLDLTPFKIYEKGCHDRKILKLFMQT